MAKFSGIIGFRETVDNGAGVWNPDITKKQYCGDFVRNSCSFQLGESVNNDVTTRNEISIVADPFVKQNFHNIVYAEYMGVKWAVTNVEVKYPRLVLTIGGKYNE